MDIKLVLWLLGIIGTFGTVALSINAFFLKGIYDDLNAVKVVMTESISDSRGREKRLANVENEVKDFREKFHYINTQISQIKSLHLFKDKK